MYYSSNGIYDYFQLNFGDLKFLFTFHFVLQNILFDSYICDIGVMCLYKRKRHCWFLIKTLVLLKTNLINFEFGRPIQNFVYDFPVSGRFFVYIIT